MIHELPKAIECVHDFTGREWVFEKVNSWLADHDGAPVFLLTGGPGTGKWAKSSRPSNTTIRP